MKHYFICNRNSVKGGQLAKCSHDFLCGISYGHHASVPFFSPYRLMGFFFFCISLLLVTMHASLQKDGVNMLFTCALPLFFRALPSIKRSLYEEQWSVL